MKNVFLIIFLTGCAMGCSSVKQQSRPHQEIRVNFSGISETSFMQAVKNDPVFSKPGSTFVDPQGRKCRVVKVKDGQGLTWENIK